MAVIAEGTPVRLVRLDGPASPSLRGFRGQVGTVDTVRDRAGARVYGVRFVAWNGEREVFWLKESEIEAAG